VPQLQGEYFSHKVAAKGVPEAFMEAQFFCAACHFCAARQIHYLFIVADTIEG